MLSLKSPKHISPDYQYKYNYLLKICNYVVQIYNYKFKVNNCLATDYNYLTKIQLYWWHKHYLDVIKYGTFISSNLQLMNYFS